MSSAFGAQGAGSLPGEPRKGPGRFLIVDDAEPIVRTLREILHRLGHAREDVAHAATPEEALAHFKKDPPRLVFMEFIGVHADEGLDVIHEMLERAPQTCIVLLTAESRESPEVRAALRAGIFAYVEKPLRMDKIRAVMQDLASEDGNIVRYR